jgi:hypothetical protein
MAPKPKRRWYQFSLKALLGIITLLCGGPGGYVAYEQKKARNQHAARRRFKGLGRKSHEAQVCHRPPTMKWVLGDDTYTQAICVDFSAISAHGVKDADLLHLQGVPSSPNSTQLVCALR